MRVVKTGLSDHEALRLEELKHFAFLCAERKGELERLCQITRRLLAAKSCSVTLFSSDEMTFLSSEGLDSRPMPRKQAFCNITLERDAYWESPDLLKDERCRAQAEILGLRHYAGVPLAPTPGLSIGTLCVVGREPRTLNAHQKSDLIGLASVVEDLMRLYRASQDLKQREILLAQARDEAEAANNAKSAFLATMSHEIRTPLNGVLGMAQAMAFDDLSPVQRERLGIIRQSGEDLLAILNDLLDLSKIEVGKLDLEVIEFDLAEIVRGAHSAFTALANKKGLSFALDIDPTAQGVYRGDPTRVRQILYNLISNALKFTDQGEIRVAGSRTHGELCLSVTDTGMGIPEDSLPKLFERFSQADASTTRRFGGTGLGLAICSQLAKLMGGAIEAESTVGRGSTFRLRVPLPRVGDARAPAAVAAPAAPTEEEHLELRVLAAEDNAVNQLVLKTLLHQIGIAPVVVENGALAVEAWNSQRWDVILMDVQMPVMDGLTATRTIREREVAEGRARTPIIALTANAMAHQIAEYRACGMDGHVSKPIEVRHLFAALQSAIGPAEENSPPAQLTA